ncbi:MAG: D-alanyl-D-alanine carboxypeptidase [Clostridiales bacterium]|nr:D-alanyl-D-alanine carboxypeptidase [Clostridiales bacterium]
MKNKLISLILLACLSFGGCQKTSGEMLAFKEMKASSGFTFDSQLMEADFFAKNLAIISEEENYTEDTLGSSEASLLIDITNNEIIHADNVYEKLYPASLTKLMTALIVLRYGELTDLVTVSYNASHITESGAKLCGFKEGDIVSLEALLNALLIYSGNDVGIAIAEHIGGSEEGFAKMMNEEAKKIGAVHSNFVNAHGLHDDNHYTTAYDLYLIFNELIPYDTFLSIINTPSYTVTYTDKDGNNLEKTFATTNRYLNGKTDLIEHLEIIGGKTGTTFKAGNCLILLSKDNSAQYISLILKASSGDQLYSEMSQILSTITE